MFQKVFFVQYELLRRRFWMLSVIRVRRQSMAVVAGVGVAGKAMIVIEHSAQSNGCTQQG